MHNGDFMKTYEKSKIPRLFELMEESGVKASQITRDLHISSGNISDWKSGKAAPTKAALITLADYLGTTPEYLLGETEKKEKPSAEKREEPSILYLENKKLRMLPVYESVSAGFGAQASDYIVDYLPCYVSNVSEIDEYLCIKVKGDSMFPKIEDGDIIQVHKQTSVDSGSIAVLLIDGEEGVVKRVVYGDDWIELHSINPMYPVMRYEGADVLRLQVVGLVKKIIKDA